VCESANCPNLGECWNQKSATFMMLGNLCTRRCGFCAVPKGRPEPIDLDEPRRVAYAVAQLGLAHAVITSVNRDDDNLGSARAFAEVIREIRAQAAGCRVEVLTPDFQGNDESLRIVVAARPEILNHNIETVPRLYRIAKSGGKYSRSLGFLRRAKELAAEAGWTQVTKTGIIVGMGEEMHELLAVFRDLAERRVDILTIGQYLRPSRDHLVMQRFYTPEEFAFLKHEALAMDFAMWRAGRWFARATTRRSRRRVPGWRNPHLKIETPTQRAKFVRRDPDVGHPHPAPAAGDSVRLVHPPIAIRLRWMGHPDFCVRIHGFILHSSHARCGYERQSMGDKLKTFRNARRGVAWALAMLLAAGGAARAQTQTQADKQSQSDDPLHTASRVELDVAKVLLAQEKAWNRGDLEGYAKGYKDSPETLCWQTGLEGLRSDS